VVQDLILFTDLNKINYFIENRREEFSDKEVKTIVDRLKGEVDYSILKIISNEKLLANKKINYGEY